MKIIDRAKIIDRIESVTVNIKSYEDDFLGFYQFISKSIANKQDTLPRTSIELIVVENLYEDFERMEIANAVVQKKEREVVNFFIFGDFEEDLEITQSASEILAEFYVEYLILPIINNVNYQEFESKSNYFLEQIKNGVIVYEAKRSLHRNSTAIHS